MGTMKTSDLTGAALDWAVGKCVHKHIRFWPNGQVEFLHPNTEWTTFTPSINWSQAGPIIEQEKISLDADNSPDWLGMTPNGKIHNTGPTPLIAAMRCYVASKLGNEVEIPEELL